MGVLLVLFVRIKIKTARYYFRKFVVFPRILLIIFLKLKIYQDSSQLCVY